MYQPEGFPAPLPEGDIEAFTVPTARETTDAPAKPGRICPDKPDRECMIRYLYAQKHRHNVKCATCGQVSAKVSSMRRIQKSRTERERLTGMTDIERRRIKQREYEAKRKARRQARLAARTPEEIEAQRQKRLEQLARGRETQRLMREAGISKEKAPALTPEQIQQKKEREKAQRLANLEKAREASAKIKAAAERKIAKQHDDSEKRLHVNLELARAGKKPASRCEAVVLALEWMLESGLESVAMLDLMPAVNKYMSKKIPRSGNLGKSVRDYGLTVHVEYVGGGVSRSTLCLDDKARAFVSGGWRQKMHGYGTHLKNPKK